MNHHEYWNALSDGKRFRRALVLSIVLHVAAVFAVTRLVPGNNLDMPAIGYEVEFVAGPIGMPNPPAPGLPEPPAPAAPPEPAPEPPIPEPPKPEPPKPKAEEKPVEKEKPKVEKKPVEKEKTKEKEKPKDKAKDKSKDTAKTKTGKTGDDPNAKERPNSSRGPTQDLRGINPTDIPNQTGVVPAGVPGELLGWSNRVRVKVEKTWKKPAGLLATTDNQAWVSFWVDKSGNLIGEPEVTKQAADPELAASAIQAIKDAAPLPELPPDYPQLEQEVLYVFTLVEY